MFGDESGNFDFSRSPGASRYFILTTITTEDVTIEQDLLALRRQLQWEGHDLPGPFHATEDKQAVRDEVFNVLSGHSFRIDATILDKPKTRPEDRPTEEHFYELAWYLHFQHLAPAVLRDGDELLAVGASLGTKKKRTAMHSAVQGAIKRCSVGVEYRTAFWLASSDPCLQVADYCSWAIFRLWEQGDNRSRLLIQSKLATEFDAFHTHGTLYY